MVELNLQTYSFPIQIKINLGKIIFFKKVKKIDSSATNLTFLNLFT